MLISPAMAQETADYAASPADYFMSFLPLLLIFVIFYFFIIRPQQRRVQEHRALVNNLRRGDKVVTGGGLIGRVSKVVDDNEIEIELAEGIKVRAVRQTITANLSNTTLYPQTRPPKAKDTEETA